MEDFKDFVENEIDRRTNVGKDLAKSIFMGGRLCKFLSVQMKQHLINVYEKTHIWINKDL